MTPLQVINNLASLTDIELEDILDDYDMDREKIATMSIEQCAQMLTNRILSALNIAEGKQCFQDRDEQAEFRSLSRELAERIIDLCNKDEGEPGYENSAGLRYKQ